MHGPKLMDLGCSPRALARSSGEVRPAGAHWAGLLTSIVEGSTRSSASLEGSRGCSARDLQARQGNLAAPGDWVLEQLGGGHPWRRVGRPTGSEDGEVGYSRGEDNERTRH